MGDPILFSDVNMSTKIEPSPFHLKIIFNYALCPTVKSIGEQFTQNIYAFDDCAKSLNNKLCDYFTFTG